MKSRKIIQTVLAAMGVVSTLSGCAGTKQERISIDMYMWDRSMFKELSPWLQETFPQYDFNFIQSYNTMAYYNDMINRGEDIPDIITCRRFSLNDAAALSDELMDLSKTEVAGTFYSSYLEVNRENSGAIRWLPMCAEVDGTVANKDLFDAYGLELPTDYSGFVAAVDFFEERGIKGYQTDWTYDYTCLETLQGSSIPDLMSLEGTAWRRDYESETDQQVGLSEEVWMPVFEKYEQFLRDVHFLEGDEELDFDDVVTPFLEGKTAMIRATAAMADILYKDNGINCVVLPYFGESEEDNWILTYPMCQLAVSKNVEADSAKKKAVLEVVSAIFTEQGQKHVAAGTSVLSYNKQVRIEPTPAMQYAQDCIDRNHLYMRLASTEMFSVSQDVVHKMMTGEYGPEGAFADFTTQISMDPSAKVEEVLFTQNRAYDIGFGTHGSPAASAVINTLRTLNNEDIAIGYTSVISSQIYSGDYTKQQAEWLMTPKNELSSCTFTGAEIRQIMEWLVNVKEDGSNPIRHRNFMPVTSGMEYTVRETEHGKFQLESITVNGRELQDGDEYTVLLAGADNIIEHEAFCHCPMPENIREKRDANKNPIKCQTYLIEALTETQQLSEPTEYVTIQ
ncbi:MAG: 5'-nucleotidase C-terminal domain-containing protein [Bulleidia sp.]